MSWNAASYSGMHVVPPRPSDMSALLLCRAAQAQSYEEKLQDDLYEMSKPLARYADDEDLEKMLKEKERAGDPMLAFIKKSKPSSDKPSKRAKRGKIPPPPQPYTIINIWCMLSNCREANIQRFIPTQSVRNKTRLQMGRCEQIQWV